MAFDFPNAPTVGQVYSGYVYDGEKWLTQPAKGSKKNYIINGAMMISQENGTTAGTVAGYYPVDQFYINSAGTTGTYTCAQVASPTPGGSSNRVRIIATGADAAVAAGDLVYFGQRLEGLRVSDLMFGTAAAKTITIQFGIKAPAGTYCVSVANSAGNRSYVSQYVIAAGEANTDVIKSVTLPGDTTGTWLTDNTIGIQVNWGLMAGSASQQAGGSWIAGGALGTSSQFNFMGTGGNTFELFDVSLTEGSIAPPFQVPDYASELAACQRYMQYVYGALDISATGAGVTAVCAINFLVSMRASPTAAIAAYTFARTNMAAETLSVPTGPIGIGLYLSSTSSAAGRAYSYPAISLNARL